MKIVLLHDEVGERSSPDEIDVIAQMNAIEASLALLGHRSIRLPCTLNLLAACRAVLDSGAELIFNLVESLGGHGRLIHLAPAMLDAIAVPYTGCPADAVWMTSNKLAAKQLLRALRIPTPTWYSRSDLERHADVASGRYIIKSVWEHASRGLDEDSVVHADRAEQLLHELRMRLPNLGGEGFAEAYIEGREFNLSLLGRADSANSCEPTHPTMRHGCEVLPAAEIVFEEYAAGKPRVVGYRAKWDEQSFEFSHTPRQFDFNGEDHALVEQLASTARECWSCFGLRGYARVDFRVDEAGRPFVLEVNTNPCLSPDAGFAAALVRAGVEFHDAVARIIGAARGARA